MYKNKLIFLTLLTSFVFSIGVLANCLDLSNLNGTNIQVENNNCVFTKDGRKWVLDVYNTSFKTYDDCINFLNNNRFAPFAVLSPDFEKKNNLITCEMNVQNIDNGIATLQTIVSIDNFCTQNPNEWKDVNSIFGKVIECDIPGSADNCAFTIGVCNKNK